MGFLRKPLIVHQHHSMSMKRCYAQKITCAHFPKFSEGVQKVRSLYFQHTPTQNPTHVNTNRHDSHSFSQKSFNCQGNQSVNADDNKLLSKRKRYTFRTGNKSNGTHHEGSEYV